MMRWNSNFDRLLRRFWMTAQHFAEASSFRRRHRRTAAPRGAAAAAPPPLISLLALQPACSLADIISPGLLPQGSSHYVNAQAGTFICVLHHVYIHFVILLGADSAFGCLHISIAQHQKQHQYHRHQICPLSFSGASSTSSEEVWWKRWSRWRQRWRTPRSPGRWQLSTTKRSFYRWLFQE